MNAPKDAVLDHSVFDSARRLQELLDGLDADLRTIVEQHAPQTLDRCGALVDLILGLADAVDPLLASQAALSQAQTHIDQLVAWLPQLPQSPGLAGNFPGQVDAAVDAASRLVVAVGPLPKLTDEIGKKIGRAVSRKATAMGRELDELSGQLAELRVELDAGREAATAADEQRVAVQQQRLVELGRGIDVERQRVDAFVTTAVNENEAQEKKRNQLAQDLLDEQKTTFEAMLERSANEAADLASQHLAAVAEAETRAQERISDLQRDLKARAGEIVAHLEARKVEIDKLHEVTVQSGLTGAFAKEATDQAGIADGWRIGTILAGLVAVGFAVFTALHDAQDLTFEALSAKLAVTLGFAALATYCAKQSGQHRQRESAAKALELDLAALAPFLQQLQPEQRKAPLEAFVSRWMATRAVTTDPSVAFGAANLVDVATRALPLGDGDPPRR